uniref:Uncharacterized protein n=1 Tax=Anopheles funestus TaxID=62324 RepID=A0A182S0V4_ANOFN
AGKNWTAPIVCVCSITLERNMVQSRESELANGRTRAFVHREKPERGKNLCAVFGKRIFTTNIFI